jgi:hypothetical protein
MHVLMEYRQEIQIGFLSARVMSLEPLHDCVQDPLHVLEGLLA